jgi:hypothetical protein
MKLTVYNRNFIPDVSFPTDDGRERNRDMSPDKQVSCEVDLCTIGEREMYLSSNDVEGCVSAKCKGIKGLSDFGITNGESLVKAVNCGYIDLIPMVNEIYAKACAMHDDEHNPKMRHLSDGEFSSGE